MLSHQTYRSRDCIHSNYRIDSEHPSLNNFTHLGLNIRCVHFCYSNDKALKKADREIILACKISEFFHANLGYWFRRPCHLSDQYSITQLQVLGNQIKVLILPDDAVYTQVRSFLSR